MYLKSEPATAQCWNSICPRPSIVSARTLSAGLISLRQTFRVIRFVWKKKVFFFCPWNLSCTIFYIFPQISVALECVEDISPAHSVDSHRVSACCSRQIVELSFASSCICIFFFLLFFFSPHTPHKEYANVHARRHEFSRHRSQCSVMLPIPLTCSPQFSTDIGMVEKNGEKTWLVVFVFLVHLIISHFPKFSSVCSLAAFVWVCHWDKPCGEHRQAGAARWVWRNSEWQMKFIHLFIFMQAPKTTSSQPRRTLKQKLSNGAWA